MTTWELSPRIDLRNDRIDPQDGARQLATADEICKRLNDQPGVILADDVGMGKTFVALAVAASVVQANPGRQVVVMVPSAVGEKWPKDWSVFQEKCLKGGPKIRATDHAVSRGSEFLKLLDDPSGRRHHIIFLTHRALSSNLDDPFVKLAVIRQAFRYQRSLAEQRRLLPQWASSLLNRRDFTPERVEALMATDPRHWKNAWERSGGSPLDDDPVPHAVLSALSKIDYSQMRAALQQVPLRRSAYLAQRLSDLRRELAGSLNDVWKQALRNVQAHLPLLIFDEAHHVKNPNQLRSLFDTGDGASSESLRGALGGVFERMLLLTATPFQLGHRELISVLRLFSGVRSPAALRTEFETTLSQLNATLDAAQAAALRLDEAWSRLDSGQLEDLPSRWWAESSDDLPENAANIARFSKVAVERLQIAATELRPWVIRHSKPRLRVYLPGASTRPGYEQQTDVGLAIEQQSVLPFLLAARAQAYVSLKGLQENRRVRALFADGLASSFEAYTATRASSADSTDDTEAQDDDGLVADVAWYLDRIAAALPTSDAGRWAAHPKVNATIERALSHWRTGDKVLVFCFYRATGRALREHLSAALAREIATMGRQTLRVNSTDVEAVLGAITDRADSLFRSDRVGGRVLLQRVRELGTAALLEDEDADHLADVVLRFMRTPSFLVRYVDLGESDSRAVVEAALRATDGSGMTLTAKLEAFARQVRGMTAPERLALWDALETLHTGSRRAESAGQADDLERAEDGVLLLPNVHLANGETKAELRRRLMVTFNTPFLPEILVASSVMAEGVDLHRDCRHVIHHDLDWNPSTLEQRTGRVDRLGSKASMTGQQIVVCEPYVAGTQDEKQYVVVKDRDRWFGVLMGGRVPGDEWATDKIAERARLPDELLSQLTLDLWVWKPPTV